MQSVLRVCFAGVVVCLIGSGAVNAQVLTQELDQLARGWIMTGGGAVSLMAMAGSCDGDTTPPTARLDVPTFLSCECVSPVPVGGIACDDDGAYGFDRAEFRDVEAAPGTPWTLIGESTMPACAPMVLYGWDVSSVPNGTYYVRLTVDNACGLTSTDITTVFIDKSAPTVEVTEPQGGSEVCGRVDIVGTVQENCGTCFDSYVVEYAAVGSSVFLPVDPGQLEYDDIIINGTLATWDTTALGLSPGVYIIRVSAVDVCDNEQIRETVVGLETDCEKDCVITCSGDTDGNGEVDFVDLLTVLAGWGPCP